MVRLVVIKTFVIVVDEYWSLLEREVGDRVRNDMSCQEKERTS